MRIQHHDLGVGEAVPYYPMEFTRLEVRQRRVQKKYSVVGCVLVEQPQSFGSAGCLKHVPAGRAQLSLKLLAEPGIGAYDEDVNRNPVFESP
jgi:hypothetical protein